MAFEKFENKKIFMTGGTGFFGKTILSMMKRGFLPETELTILSRNPVLFLADNPEFSTLKRVKFVSGDVLNFEFPSEKFDYIIHAATPAVTTLAPGKMREVIIEGTRHVLKFAQKCQPQKLLFASSGAVYGTQPPEVENIPETLVCRPVNEYGTAKLEAEQMCVDSGIFTLLPRCFAFVGPYLNLDIHFAIGNFIRNGLNGEPIIIKGDGRPWRSYLYADDLAQWLFAILERGENGRPYNVGSDYGLPLSEIARIVAEQFSPVPAIRILGVPVPGTAAPRYVPDISRAKSELDLSVTASLSLSISKTILHHRT